MARAAAYRVGIRAAIERVIAFATPDRVCARLANYAVLANAAAGDGRRLSKGLLAELGRHAWPRNFYS